jgi:hypothetical protein
MFRCTLIRLTAKPNPATALPRTIVRDPRKKIITSSPNSIDTQNKIQPVNAPDKIGPQFGAESPPSTGVILGSYALAGVGVALGAGLVRLIFGF